MALIAFQSRAILHEPNRRLTCRTGEDFKQFRVNGHRGIYIGLVPGAVASCRASCPCLVPVHSGANAQARAQHLALGTWHLAPVASKIEGNMFRARFIFVLFVGVPAITAGQTTPPPNPSQAQAYYEFMMARYFESKGDTSAALEALKRAEAADPKSADIQAEFAGYYARQNKAVEAVAAGERALTLNPNNVEAHRILGLVYAAWSDGAMPPPPGRTPAQLRASAVAHLAKVIDTPTVATDLNLQLTLGRLHLRSGRPDLAIPVLENIVSQAPFAAEPYTLLSEARLAVGKVDEAAQALALAAEINPRHYLTLAELYEKQERWEDAAAAYGEAIAAQKNPGRDLRLRWTMALLNVPDPKAVTMARDALKQIVSSAPQDTRALYLLSNASRQVGDLPAAEDAARKLLAIEPANLSGLYALSVVMLDRREFRQVVDLLTPFAKDVAVRAKERESEAARLLTHLGHAHSELGQPDQAVAAFTDAIRRDPLNAPALNALGYLLADRGQRLPEAVGYIERALKVDPDNPAYLDSLGWALFKQGKVAEAEPHLRKAADTLSKESVIQDHLGDVLAKSGKIDEAIAAWQRALSGDGQDVDRATIEKKIKSAKGRKP